jgi:hypothetical protein
MNRMIRSIRTTLSTAVILCAFALTPAGDTLAAFDSQPKGVEEQHRRHHDELTFSQFDYPGARQTNGNGINDRKQIVGFFIDAEGVLHGFLLDNGVFSQIDPPGSTETQLGDINDRGHLVGIFVDAGIVGHSFVAKCDSKKSDRGSIERPSPAGQRCNGEGQAK